jgi:hypothetical protein
MPKVDVSAVPVRVGTGYPDPDVDMMSSNRDGKFVRKNGRPYA